MFLSKVSINRPVMMTMFIAVFIVFGIMAYQSLSLDLMAKVDIPYLSIQTIYSGAGPKEIELQISKRIEDAVSTVSRIKMIQSYSMDNVSIVLLEFELGKDIDVANQEVKDKIDAVLNDFPTDSDKPVISKFEMGSLPIINLILTGDVTPRELYEIADKQLKDRFAQIEGVAQVNLSGGMEREIRVEFDDRIVFSNNISLSQMSQILAANNLEMPGGSFINKDQEYSVRSSGEYNMIDEISNLDIPTAQGVKKLNQLADVNDSSSDVRERTIYFNNETKNREPNVVKIDLVKTSSGNTVKIADEAKKMLPEIEKTLPNNVSLNLVNDRSLFIKSSVDDTISNIILGIIFTGLILFFFLHDLRSTFIIALTMPTSIISTFLLIKMSDFSLNVMTLMGLSTSVGILVTNSVVVIENIFRHMKMGNTRKEASDKGTAEIAVAVIASTLTNIAVFLPIATMSSLVGQIFKQFALTVTFATIFSLLMSFILTPMLSSLILPEKQKKSSIGKGLDRFFEGMNTLYGKLLSKLLKRRIYSFLLPIPVFIILILCFGLVVKGYIGAEFIPNFDEGNLGVSIELPQGYNLNETAKLFEEVEEIIIQHPEIKHTITNLGATGDLNKGVNLGKIDIKLVDADERSYSSDEMVNILIQELSVVPNAQIKVSMMSSMGSGDDSPIQFYLKGQDLETLNRINDIVLEKVKNVPGIINFDSSVRTGKPEISIIPNRQKLSEVGATVYDVALTVRAAVEGIVATQFKEDGNEYDIRLTFSDESVNSSEKIANLPIVTQSGVYRLSQLAEVGFSQGYSTIIHKDKFIAISYTGGNAAGVPMGTVVSAVGKILEDIELPPGYEFDWGGDSQMMNEFFVDITKAFLLAILLTYMLLAAILESFIQPFLILMTVPLALIGVLLALFLTGQALNIISTLAIVMLVGIVVNNAILLLDYTNQLVRSGVHIKEALITACPTKLQPIIMSSLAIVIGMLPMAMGIGSAGKEFRQAMGIVSIGGVIASAILTLVLIPTGFYAMHIVTDCFRKKCNRTAN
ncbi:MAG: efflux RND transporter permease subunit [Candidatus Cloacimonetes bacterium]|nr:efflux RND transporter permease subunit [Candidatus Cloacimonadota bacterium]